MNEQSMVVNDNKGFWKKNSHNVPGRPSPKKSVFSSASSTSSQSNANSSFQAFQFSFRWMNNLLTREVPLRCSIRLWDTYLAESDDFAAFQLYVCAAFLLHWRQKLLRERDFQGLMLMLQNLPTSNWSDHDIGVLVAEAYRFKVAFADAPNHLSGSKIKR
uniref:TBC1 domain family member 22A n=1 Tax=Cacopsylla melanoneura TaxID=428564 RepID=A0A8D9EF92_9HEMI